jgi:ADP-heptose:LPS heptosyltransferase
MMKILVQRRDSLGDVVEVTPVTHRLRLEYPDAEIYVETGCPAVFRDSPDGVRLHQNLPFDKVYDLNMVQENAMGKVHPVHAYMEAVFGDRNGSTQLRMAVGAPPNLGWHDYSHAIAIHAARSWPNRTLPWQFWRELASLLVKRGWDVAAIGTGQDWPMGGYGITDTCSTLDLKQQLGLLQVCKAFICSQSGPMIFAQATDVPIVCLNTIGPVHYIEHERHGIMGWGLHHINSPVTCFNCYERITEPTTHLKCARGDNLCVTQFHPEYVADIAEQLIERHK